MLQKHKSRTEIQYAVAKIQASVLAFVVAVISGLTIFLATVWLLIKGGPNVGQHLQLLEQYFPGYKVTWIGSFIGMLYGAIAGGISGWLIGFIYNRIVGLKKQ
jgi:hypothetical protein